MSRTPHRFLSALLNRPQMIEPAAGAAVLAVLAPSARLDGWDGEATNDARDEREYQIINGIAVIPVVGELVHRGAGLKPVSGCCSYQAIADAMTDALSDARVRAVLLDIDSPGGEAAGCLDFSERIRAMRGPKPIWASINQRATSAAYAIASAADRVLIGKDGHAGSIGVVSYHTDVSQALDKAGVVVTYLYAGARKIDGAPALPLSEDARAAFQANIDALYGRFCEVVAVNRGLTVEAVRATEAAIYRGEDAVTVGLADAIATQEEALMSISTQSAPSGARLTTATEGTKMEDQTEGSGFKPCADCKTPGECSAAKSCKQDGMKAPENAEAKPADPVAVAEACQNGGYPELTAALLKAGATMSAVNERIGEAKAIADACARLHVPDMASKLIVSGVSLEMARDIASTAAAARSDSIVTDTTRANAPAPSDGWDSAVSKANALAGFGAGKK